MQVVPIKVVTHALPQDSSVDIYIVSSLADFGRLPFFFGCRPKAIPRRRPSAPRPGASWKNR